jgi:protein O-GlcNAc transferase
MESITGAPAETLNRAVAACNDGNLFEAERLCQSIIAVRPGSCEVLRLLADVQAALDRSNDALATYEQVLSVQTDDAVVWNNRGVVLQRLQQFDEALASYERAIALRPDFADALYNRGAVLQQFKRFEDALTNYHRVLVIRLDHAAALHNRGIILHELKRFEDALASCDQALSARPDHLEALNSRGITLHALKRFEDALASYDKVLAIRPGHIEALSNRGVILHELKRFDEALASYEHGLRARSDDAAALYNRGTTLHELRRFEAAVLSFEHALAARPDYAAALSNRGITLHELKLSEEALASLEKAIGIRPTYGMAWSNRGLILRDLKRFEEATASFEKAISLEPNNKYALSGLADCAMKMCDWARREKLSRDVCRHVSEQQSIVSPFVLLGYSEDQSLQTSCGRNYFRDLISVPPQPLWRGAVWRKDKIKLAYVSADFRAHAIAYLTAELFELHDRSQFDVIAMSLGPDDRSEMRARLVAAFDQFFDVGRKSDRETARLINDLRVDIAVDLQGYTKDARPGIFAFRPAPVQVSYLGFPSTLGGDFIDYIIADPIILPLDRQPYYSEKIVHLPECYQVNDRKRTVAPRTPTRAEVGLPAQGFIFCCFNNSWKITPAVFDIWMRLLRLVEGSVLWLLKDNKNAERNLRNETLSRGVDPTRVVFAEHTKIEDHLARYRLADLFLDTLPYNAHATASDALWAGLPVLTCQGQAFAGRVASSLLRAIGLPELVTYSLEEYEAQALHLAREPDLLRHYRNRLVKNRFTQPLFDTDRFRRHIEAAYCRMWELWRQGEKPESFAIATVGDDEL